MARGVERVANRMVEANRRANRIDRRMNCIVEACIKVEMEPCRLAALHVSNGNHSPSHADRHGQAADSADRASVDDRVIAHRVSHHG